MRLLSAALALTMALGCGKVTETPPGDGDGDAGGDGDGDGDGGVVSACPTGEIGIGDLKPCYLEAFCELTVNCSAGFFSFSSIEECRASLFAAFPTLEIELDRLIAAVNAGAVIYQPENLRECFDGIASCVPNEAACEQIFTGNAVAGQSCFIDAQCGAGGDCEKTQSCEPGACCAGTCEIPVPEGSSCSNGEPCAAGTHCVPLADNSASFCRGGAVGDECDTDFRCDEENFCDEDNRMCVARNIEGGDCIEDDECLRPTTCVSGKCRLSDSIDEPCQGSCVGQLFCSGDTADVPGTCQALPGDGGDCSDSDRCNSSDLFCNDVTCEPKRADGQGCNSDSNCQIGLTCDNTQSPSICVQRVADGLDCLDSDICESFNCQGADPASGNPGTCEPLDLCF